MWNRTARFLPSSSTRLAQSARFKPWTGPITNQPHLVHFQFAVGARLESSHSSPSTVSHGNNNNPAADWWPETGGEHSPRPGRRRLQQSFHAANFDSTGKFFTMPEKREHEESLSRQAAHPGDRTMGKRALKRLRKGGKQRSTTVEGSPEEVLLADVQAAIAAYRLSLPADQDKDRDGNAPLPDGRQAEEGAEGAEGAESVVDGEGEPSASATAAVLPEQGSEIEVEVFALSSTGEGLARQPGGSDRIYVVSYVVPGDRARVRVWREVAVSAPASRAAAGPSQDSSSELPPEPVTWTTADFLSVVRASPQRDDARIKCQYFGRCPGCQLQMLSYPDQLRHKREIVVQAFRRFSDLPPELVPAVLDTVGSPLQYGYRTKLTPHFDGPPGYWRKHKTAAQRPTLEECPPVGFTPRVGRKVLDIEDCPIGTEAVRRGMTRERARMKAEFRQYTKGATILLRESTRRVMKTGGGNGTGPERDEEDGGGEETTNPCTVRVETDTHVDYKTCITDNNATSTEYVDDFVFENPAGSFFQNNNSILTPFTGYIRENIISSAPPADAATAPPRKPIRYLVDAYSGSGLFTITLSSLFSGGSIGIDIAERSIASARRNAYLNGLAPAPPAPSLPPSSDKASKTAKRERSRSPFPSITATAPATATASSPSSSPSSSTPRCSFIAADANALFDHLPEGRCHPDETVVVLDPPRKGCDEGFLRQLLRFAPARVVYVSCNVHTQARDVGVLVRGEAELGGADGGKDGGGSSGGGGGGSSGNGDSTGRKGIRYEIESIRGFDFFPQTGHVEGVAILNRVEG